MVCEHPFVCTSTAALMKLMASLIHIGVVTMGLTLYSRKLHFASQVLNPFESQFPSTFDSCCLSCYADYTPTEV